MTLTMTPNVEPEPICRSCFSQRRYLVCPFPYCLLENPRRSITNGRLLRASVIRYATTHTGATVEAVAPRLGISRRTAFRDLYSLRHSLLDFAGITS